MIVANLTSQRTLAQHAAEQRMFEYPDGNDPEVFLKPDLAIRRACKIFTDMMREEAASHSEAAE